jgi:NADH:ubiquinone oxidoreductase subunit 2 (subunit N)
VLSLRDEAVAAAGAGEYFALLLARSPAWSCSRAPKSDHAVRRHRALSIPLYALCAAEVRREASLEAGLKYLIIGRWDPRRCSTGWR